jgi:hypothetical protein
MTVAQELLAGVGVLGLAGVYALLQARPSTTVISNSLLDAYDEGHIADDVLDIVLESAEACEELAPEYVRGIGGESKGYARWACRIASEYKLEFGIPTRTVANRDMVRTILYKRLAKRNTRHRHLRCVLPLAIELCFLKDASELELERLMRQPEMVARAQESVRPYWAARSLVERVARATLPRSVFGLLEVLYPGTFKQIPGFSA